MALAIIGSLFAGQVAFCQPVNTPATIGNYNLEVSTNSTTVLVFPAAIKAVDRGKSLLLAKKVDGVDNVLKIKAAVDTMNATSLHVFTADGGIYPFIVRYSDVPIRSTINFSETGAVNKTPPVHFNDSPLTEAAIENISRQLVNQRTERFIRRSKHVGGMQLILQDCYLHNGILFFLVKVKNGSGIPFPVHFVRGYVRDKHTSRRTSIMDVEKPILYQTINLEDRINSHESVNVVLALSQFTIADQKKFSIELYELNGDRHLFLSLKGKHLLKSLPLPGNISH
ncbi:hypothetical protein BW716_06265 [[Flexibacter] sp. ATCC 35208]|nr:hypothetical protein BW716_06265 [[Flexibacter] sp. ATCC 35208]